MIKVQRLKPSSRTLPKHKHEKKPVAKAEKSIVRLYMTIMESVTSRQKAGFSLAMLTTLTLSSLSSFPVPL